MDFCRRVIVVRYSNQIRVHGGGQDHQLVAPPQFGTTHRLRHRQELLLVYELVPNGNLDSYLHGGSATTLEWGVRLRVTLGLASALFYLHEEWEQCMVHRDIKSSNIMLDLEFIAKLGDFGLVRLLAHDGRAQTMIVLAGTRGYMAPEYIFTSKASKESDVHSFGVMSLEIASGRKPLMVEMNGMAELVRLVWELYGKKMILEATDARLQGEFDRRQMECLMVVGLWCAHPDPKAQAISALNFEAPLLELPLVDAGAYLWCPVVKACLRMLK